MQPLLMPFPVCLFSPVAFPLVGPRQKLESMKIINEQETIWPKFVYLWEPSAIFPHKHGRFDMNIAIRSSHLAKIKFNLARVAGIVLDSNVR